MLGFDWNSDKKITLDLLPIKKKYLSIHDIIVSSDGEKVGLIVETDDKKITPIINENPWEQKFEKICYPQFLPDGTFACLVLNNYEWTLAIDQKLLDQTFDYAWNLKHSQDGKTITFNIKKDNNYSIFMNGKAWEKSYFDSRELFISPDGNNVATYVRTKNPPLLDIFGFKEGVWTVSVNSKEWDKNFISLYGASFSPNSSKIAATVRLSQQEYTVAVNGLLWDKIFLNAWEPIFISDNDVCVPAKTEQGWTLFLNEKNIWKNYYSQIWYQKVSPDGENIAATVATDLGKWTIALNDSPWNKKHHNVVLCPIFSPNSKKIAAVVREKNLWTVAVNGVLWKTGFDRIWTPKFSPDSANLIAKAEKDGIFFIVVNGKIGKDTFDVLWDPIFSPDGEKVLIRAIKNDRYTCKILTLGEIFR